MSSNLNFLNPIVISLAVFLFFKENQAYTTDVTSLQALLFKLLYNIELNNQTFLRSWACTARYFRLFERILLHLPLECSFHRRSLGQPARLEKYTYYGCQPTVSKNNNTDIKLNKKVPVSPRCNDPGGFPFAPYLFSNIFKFLYILAIRMKSVSAPSTLLNE